MRHAARTERYWIDPLMGRAEEGPKGWAEEYRLGEGETVEFWLAEFKRVAAETEKAVRSLPDLEADFALP